jgi:hypothetical protein
VRFRAERRPTESYSSPPPGGLRGPDSGPIPIFQTVSTASLIAFWSLVPVTIPLPMYRGHAATSLALATACSSGKLSRNRRISPASLARTIRSSLPTRSLPGPRGGLGVLCLCQQWPMALTEPPRSNENGSFASAIFTSGWGVRRSSVGEFSAWLGANPNLERG